MHPDGKAVKKASGLKAAFEKMGGGKDGTVLPVSREDQNNSDSSHDIEILGSSADDMNDSADNIGTPVSDVQDFELPLQF